MRISSTRAAKRFGETVRRVNREKESAVIERYGRPVAAIVSRQDLERLGSIGKRRRGSGYRRGEPDEAGDAGSDRDATEPGIPSGPPTSDASPDREPAE